MSTNDDNGPSCSTSVQTSSDDGSDEMPQVSIFKLHTEKLGVNKDMSLNEIENKIEKEFQNNSNISKGRIEPFSFITFVYGSKNRKNAIVKALEKSIAEKVTKVQINGTNISGTLVFFFRILDSDPEIFCIAKGKAFSKVINLADGTFRTKIARCSLDERFLRKHKYVTISGPNIKESHTNRAIGQIDISFDAFERVYIELRGKIIQNCKLNKIISRSDDPKNQFDIEIGQYKIRILCKLNSFQLCEIFKHFSEVCEESMVEYDNLSTLDLVRREDDSSTIKRLNDSLFDTFLSSIEDVYNSSSLSLSHSKVEDWALSSEIILLDRKDEIDRWYSTPSLEDVKNSISSNLFGNPIKKDENRQKLRRINISFLTKREDEYECKPLKNFLHGNVKYDDGETYHKIAGKWYKFTFEYLTLINKKFSHVIHKLIDENQRVTTLLLPWSHKPELSLEDVVIFFKLPEKEAQELIESFEKEIAFTETNEIKGTFEGFNSWLVESSELFKKLKENDLLKKDKKKESKKFKIEHAISDSSEPNEDLISDNDTNKLERIMCETTFLVKKNKTEPTTQSPVWTVVNPNVPAHVLETQTIPSDQFALFFRSFSKLTENEYNSNYLILDKPKCRIVYGDKVLIKNVELFDVLIHNDKTTYLLHVKEGFAQNTRDACSQIRISADLIWNSRRNYQSEKSYIKLFWETGINYKGMDVRRIELKQKLEKMGQSEFYNFFKRDVQIVFVLAFVDKNEKKLSGSLPIEVDDITKLDVHQDRANEVRALLQRQGILTDDGYVTDAFDNYTKDTFLRKIPGMNKATKDKLYTFLRERSHCQIKSPIAKMEILYLNDHFKNYISDDGYKFQLQVCQIPSDFSSWKM